MIRIRAIEVLALIAAALSVPGAARGEVTVRLRDAEVAAAEVRLSDVADIEASGVADAVRAASLQSLSLGLSPHPGAARRLNPDYVKARVLAEGFSSDEIRVVGAAVEIRRAARRVEAAEIRAAVEAALAPLLPAGARLEILRVPDGVTVPPLPVTVVATPPVRLRGPISVAVEIVAGDVRERVHVQAIVRRLESVAVAARPLERGAVVAEGDVRVEVRDVTDEAREPVREAAAALGRRLRRAAPEGAILTPALLEEVPAVEAGDAVRIRVRLSGVEVEAAGEARANGAIGALVPVRNGASHRVLMARVLGPGEVAVE